MRDKRVIPVAHDFICEWCWIGLFQARRMRVEFGAEIDWLAYELYPEGLSESRRVPEPPAANQPLTPSRLTLAFAAADLQKVMRPRVNTHSAHEAMEHARRSGSAWELAERMYQAYWQQGFDISEAEVILDLARGLIPDLDDLSKALQERRYAPSIISFNEAAHSTGVYNLPTFWLGGERYAEQPWPVLERALEAISGQTAREPAFYTSLAFPLTQEHKDRPFALINMVTTIDGKTVTGERGGHVQDLGSPVDHLMMRRLQAASQAVLIGAGSQRSSASIWYPKELFRIVATRSGDINVNDRFFSDAPSKAIVLCTQETDLPSLPAGTRAARFGENSIDWKAAFAFLRQELGVSSLLIEGGSDVNAQLLRANLVDELFLTVAPKVKLGEGVPTYAGGEPLARNEIQEYRLIEENLWQDEVFLRYRKK